MIVLAISLTLITVSAVAYSICRIPSRAWRAVRDKSLVLDHVPDAARLRELLTDGDTESVQRVLRALQQRGDIDVTETEDEIYVTGHPGVPAGKGRTITRGLLVSAYDPVEDFLHLRVTSRLHPDARAGNRIREIYAGRFEKVSAAGDAELEDHLFASDYDVGELLESLTARSGIALAAQMPS
jgi:hypothetical protein